MSQSVKFHVCVLIEYCNKKRIYACYVRNINSQNFPLFSCLEGWVYGCVYNNFGKFHFSFIVSKTLKFVGRFAGIKFVLFFCTFYL